MSKKPDGGPAFPVPCPFCRKKAAFRKTVFSPVFHAIICSSRRCGAEGPVRRSLAGAVKAWNRSGES